jgi:hypothetical protein
VKNKRIIKITCLILCITLIVGFLYVTMPSVIADVGNNNRYSSSGSSDSDSGDWFFIFYILFDLFGPIGALIIIGIIAVVFFFLKKTGRLTKAENVTTNNKVSDIVDTSNSVADMIRQTDPNFSADAFIGWTREVFLKIQQAWSDRNWELIRPFESNELFNVHNGQLDEYIKNKKINKVEKINIKKVALHSYNVDGDKEVLTVYLDAIMRDYVTDENGKVLESDPNKDWYMEYVMTFNRKVGVKTQAGLSNKSTTNCPNCGAPTVVTSSGKCDYCKSVITTGEHDWVLSDIRSRE